MKDEDKFIDILKDRKLNAKQLIQTTVGRLEDSLKSLNTVGV